MNKTTIEPTQDFLTKTAMTLAEMQDDIADQIDDKYEDEDDDTEELDNRLNILRGDIPRNKKMVDDDLENTLVTLPLKDVRFFFLLRFLVIFKTSRSDSVRIFYTRKKITSSP